MLTNVATPFNRRFVDSTENTTYLLQSVHNRSLDLWLYLKQTNHAADDPLAKQTLHIQLDQNPHNATLHNLMLRFEALQLENLQFVEFGWPSVVVRDPASNSLRIPFNSSLDLTIQFKNSNRSEPVNDDKVFRLLVNPMSYDHRLEVIFENVSTNEFLDEKRGKIVDFLASSQPDLFIKVLSCKPMLERDLQVVFAGFSNFSSFYLGDLIINSCAGENEQFNATRSRADVEPFVENFYDEFGLKLKECSVKVHTVRPSSGTPKSLEIWFDLATIKASTSSARPFAATLTVLMSSWLLWLATTLIDV